MNNKGFTLIEIVTVIIILGIISAFSMSFLLDNSRTYQMMKIQRELYQDGVYIIERISRDIRDSNRVDGSCTGGFIKTHPSRDTQLCTQYVQSGTVLLRNGQPIGRDVTRFAPNYTAVPYTVLITLERECGSSIEGGTKRPIICRMDMSTVVSPMNTAGKFNGQYDETVN
jgi:prepilin-type N-terminal cleavage/methylation domain-containing protein